MMKKFALGLAGVLSLVVSVSTVVACPNEGCAKKKSGMVAAGPGGGAASGGCAKPCHGGSSVTATASDAAKAVLASMPTVKYRVGTQMMCCPNAASVAAKTENKPVEYVVGEEAFKSLSEADARLVALYEKEIESMVAVQYSVGGESTQCPHAAKSMAEAAKAPIAYKVGGVEFADQAKAEAAVKLVADAAAAVKMNYKVGEKSFCCDKMAGEAAKGGQPIVYVVGSDELADESAAKLVLAQAKIRAIVEAANAAKSS